MFTEDYQKDDLPENCTSFFERLNEYILNQHYTDRTEIHCIRDTFKAQYNGFGGFPGNIYHLLLKYLTVRHGQKDGKKIYKHITEFTR